MRILIFAGVSIATISFICQIHGQDEYLGAEEVMDKVELKLQSENGGQDSGSDVRRMIDSLVEEADGFTGREAAEKWVSMAMAYFEIPAAKRANLQRMDPPLKMETLMAALPPSSAWDDLAKVTSEIPDKNGSLAKDSLELIVAVLRDSEKERAEAMEGLKQEFAAIHSTDSYSLKYAETYFKRLEEILAPKDEESAIAIFKEKLKAIESPSEDNSYGWNNVEVPQIAGKMDALAAKALILRAVKLKVYYSVEHEPTRRLIAKVMLENPEAIVIPIWELIETVDEIPLFEIFSKKFPADDNWRKGEAESKFASLLLGKLELNKTKDFIKQRWDANEAVDISMNDLGALSNEVQDKLIAFFGELLEENPSLPYWRVYLDLAEKAGVSEEVLEEVGKAAITAENGTTLRIDLERYFLDGLLNAGNVDEGLAYLRGLVAEHRREGSVFNSVGAEAFIDRSLTLVAMAALLEKDDVKDEAFASARLAYEALRKYSESRYHVYKYVPLLLDHGRGPEAEFLVAKELVGLSQPAMRTSTTRTSTMVALAYVYNQVGRHGDVVKLLDDSDMWDLPDLGYANGASFDSKSLLLIAAESLFAVGRVDDAYRILNRVLQSSPNKDGGYELLLKIGREGIVEKLDALYAMNRFQERPLIWKAQFLLDSGELDEAEKTVKAAIAIDPSDGDQGKGDRMRAYAVLAEIMAKKGDAKQADFLRGVVRAIRISETGDDWWAVGMQKRAIEIYEASLKQFSDAYCIQSRLALRYSEAGDFEKAAEHYRRAFELMPESFGRVESHCFGCEGAFSGELAQGIAESVFLKLSEEMPDRAQVFYLLGYLRQQQGRDADAAEQYAKAVQIDPLYINAWKKLGTVADSAGLSAERKDEIQLTLYRLNPRGQNLREVSDLAKLWDTALDVEKTYEMPEAGPVFALEFDKSGRNANNRYDNWEDSEEQKRPRMQLGRNESINGMIGLLESLHRR